MIDAFVLEHRSTILQIAFFGVISVLLLWEAAGPRRSGHGSTGLRWLNNCALGALNLIAARALLVPALNVGTALFVAERGWGVLNYVGTVYWAALMATLVVLDFTAYGLHRAAHVVPLLWRLHRVHHADPQFDFTTGFRFHPLEDAVATLLGAAVIAVLGPPVGAVVLREALVVAHGTFAHANVRLWPRLDRVARVVLVTPDVHRIHHSTLTRETDSNFGIVFSVWDRLFGTYCAQPSLGHEAMTMGLTEFRAPKYLLVHWMLALPLLSTRNRS